MGQHYLISCNLPLFYRDPPSFSFPLPPSLTLRAPRGLSPTLSSENLCHPSEFSDLIDSGLGFIHLWGSLASQHLSLPPLPSSLSSRDRPPPQDCAARPSIPLVRHRESQVLVPPIRARAGSPGDPHRSRVLLCATDPRAGGAASRRRRIGAAPRALPRAAPGNGRKEAVRGGGRHRTQSLIPRPRRRLRHCCARERATRSLGARLEPRSAGAGRGVSAGGERGGQRSISQAEGRGRLAGGQRHPIGDASRKAGHGWRPLTQP